MGDDTLIGLLHVMPGLSHALDTVTIFSNVNNYLVVNYPSGDALNALAPCASDYTGASDCTGASDGQIRAVSALPKTS